MKTRFIKRKPVVALLALGIFVGVMYTDFYMKKKKSAEKRKEYISRVYEQQAYNWIKEYYFLKGMFPKDLEDFTNSNLSVSLPELESQLKNMTGAFKVAFQEAQKSKTTWQQERQRDLDRLSKHDGNLKAQLLAMLKPDFNFVVGVPFLETVQTKYNLTESMMSNYINAKIASQQQREATAEKAIEEILNHVSNAAKVINQ